MTYLSEFLNEHMAVAKSGEVRPHLPLLSAIPVGDEEFSSIFVVVAIFGHHYPKHGKRPLVRRRFEPSDNSNDDYDDTTQRSNQLTQSNLSTANICHEPAERHTAIAY